MTNHELTDLILELSPYEPLCLKALRNAQKETGQLFPVIPITDRRERLRMFEEIEETQKACSKLIDRLQKLRPQTLIASDQTNEDLLSIFL